MENKKDIGRAVRDKLDGLQQQPAPAVWQSIRADLNANKKSRRFPLWLTTGGIVAVLLLLCSLSYPLWKGILLPQVKEVQHQNKGTGTQNQFNDGDGNKAGASRPAVLTGTENADRTESVTVSSEGAGAEKNASEKGGNDTRSEKLKIGGVKRNRPDDNTGKAASVSKKPSAKNNVTETGITNAQTGNRVRNSSAGSKAKATRNKTNTAVANTTITTLKTHRKKTTGSNGKVTDIAENNVTAPPAKGLSTKSKSGSTAVDKPYTNRENTTNAADAKTGIQNTDTATAINTGTNSTNTTGTPDTTGSEVTEVMLKDSTAVAITDTLAKKKTAKPEDDKKTDTTEDGYKQFYAYAYASPTAFKYPSGTSLLGRELNGNKAGSKATFSYGAFLGYEFTERWGVRAGISITRTEQQTSGVVTDTTASVVPSYSGINYASGVSSETLAGQFGSQPFKLIQKTQFTEVPIEVTYRLMGEQWGIKAIAGISTVRISSNEVIAQNNSGSLYMGNLKNTAAISFSAGLGAGFYYKLTPSLQLNAEPFARYYINTFSNASPISLSLRVGLQYTFNFSKKKK